ncbi:MAG: YerC/YecD family TrpR-related protein [Eubacteriales bacterium]|nr:YerC/YecD family TrpR-related protein [Eubacteriales bacterium]
MGRKVDKEIRNQLYHAVLALENEEECKAFFEDLCTVTEIFSLSQRLEVAKMLRQKKTYLTIAEETGASTATISRVNRTLNYGNGMYDVILNKMKL